MQAVPEEQEDSEADRAASAISAAHGVASAQNGGPQAILSGSSSGIAPVVALVEPDAAGDVAMDAEDKVAELSDGDSDDDVKGKNREETL